MVDQDRYIRDGLRMIPGDQFCDRRKETETLLDRIGSLSEHPVPSWVLAGPRLAGSSEVLKRVYQELYLNQDTILPLYYHFERPFHDPTAFVRDYLATLIRQYIAYQDKDSSILQPSVIAFHTVESMARERSDPGLDRVLSEYEDGLRDPDRESLVRVALHAPRMLAEGSSGYACMILDHLHLIYQMNWASCAPLSELYCEVMGYGNVPHVFTGVKGLMLRKFLGSESMAGSVRRMDLAALPPDTAAEVFLKLCEYYQVEAEAEAVKQEAGRFSGIPFYMDCVIRTAREQEAPLTSAETIQNLYFKEVSEGDIAFYYESLLNRCCRDPFIKRDAIRILTLPPLTAGETLRIEEAARRVSVDLTRVRDVTESLVLEGLLDENYGILSGSRDPVFGDFLRVAQRFWLSRADMETVRRELLHGAPEVPILKDLSKKADSEDGEESEKISFGLVLPMVSETELVAARALEQVAERVDFPEEEIGKIRMALIEACINSFEHSGIRDGKIYITFILDKEKLTIVVEDKGVSFEHRKVPVPDREKILSSPDRRGWGIELIKNLMDQVVYDEVPVGTRLRMVKYYPKNTRWKAKAG